MSTTTMWSYGTISYILFCNPVWCHCDNALVLVSTLPKVSGEKVHQKWHHKVVDMELWHQTKDYYRYHLQNIIISICKNRRKSTADGLNSSIISITTSITMGTGASTSVAMGDICSIIMVIVSTLKPVSIPVLLQANLYWRHCSKSTSLAYNFR